MIQRIISASLLLGAALFISGNLNQARAQAPAPSAASGYVTIHNDFYWTDQNGERILTRSGCLCQFNGTYYWYGGNPRGFREQYCYTSTDLIHWTNKGVILRHDVDANRIDVLYNDTTKKYVMFLKYDTNGAFLGIATADKPEGPFAFRQAPVPDARMVAMSAQELKDAGPFYLVDNARMGDMSIYKDNDGKAYLCYVSWAVGANAQHGIYLMSPDYLTLDKRIYLWDIKSREAPHIMKRNGIYYYGTSKTAGIRSSDTAYYTATNLAGPWSPAKPLDTPGSANSWDSQVDFVYPIQGTQEKLYMFAGDRWTKDLPKGRNGDYIWLPMEFNGDTPIVNYEQDWDLNLAAGTWRKFDPARNLAAGKAVTASSDDGTNVAKHVTDAKTYENYINTHWDSAAGDTQWITVDLGGLMDVNRVILKWNTSAAKDFKIQTSTDAAAWTDVFSSSMGSSYSVTDETFKTTKAKYVRMYATTHAPTPFGGRGGRRGATQPAAQPPAPTGYSLFDFMVLKD